MAKLLLIFLKKVLDIFFSRPHIICMKGNRMKIFKINCTNMKYGNKFQLSNLFSSEEKAMDFIKYLDEIEIRWDYDYEIVEELIV